MGNKLRDRLRKEGFLNGALIGIGIGCFGMAWQTHWLGSIIRDIGNWQIHSVDLGDITVSELIGLPDVNYDTMVFFLTIVGLIFLAMGIGLEVYERAKRQRSKTEE